MALTTPELTTERLRLRPFTEQDADAVWSLQTDAHVLRYWDSPPWTDREQLTRFFTRCRELPAAGTGVRVAIARRDDARFLGWATVTDWNPDFRSARLGYCFAQEAWGHGYATEAGAPLIDWAFEALPLNRLQAEADTRNAPSGRVLEKLGFVLEGTLREDCVVDGVVSDSWVYGLLRRDRT